MFVILAVGYGYMGLKTEFLMILAGLENVKSTAGLIGSTIAACFTVALTTGSSYLTILVPGELFKDAYKKKRLAVKNLSRTLEDSGTVLIPLVPWYAAGAYMAVTLGGDTRSYLPWAIMNYTGIIMAMVLAVTGFGIAKIKPEAEEGVQGMLILCLQFIVL